jgi:hypothetical protein
VASYPEAAAAAQRDPPPPLPGCAPGCGCAKCVWLRWRVGVAVRHLDEEQFEPQQRREGPDLAARPRDKAPKAAAKAPAGGRAASPMPRAPSASAKERAAAARSPGWSPGLRRLCMGSIDRASNRVVSLIRAGAAGGNRVRCSE